MTMTNSISRRKFGSMALAGAAATSSLLIPARPAQARQSTGAYLQHWGSDMSIHPSGGTPGEDVPLVTYRGLRGSSRYYIDFQEGPWGYLFNEEDPRFCVRPGRFLGQGDAGVDAPNNSMLALTAARTASCYFALDQEKNLIRHISGRYWHPSGGSSTPGNDNPVVLYDGHNKATEFLLTYGVFNKPFFVDLQAETGSTWTPVFQDLNPTTTRTHEFTRTVGLQQSKSTTVSEETTVGISMEATLFGVKSTVLASIKRAFSTESSETWSVSSTTKDTYNIVAGKPIVVWALTYKATFDQTLSYSYVSKNITYDTDSPSKPPPPYETL